MACGGGGGGSGGTFDSGGYDQPKVGIVNTVPLLPNYTGEELYAYNSLNNARVKCGFGYLQQNINIDLGAKNHIRWMVNNKAYQQALLVLRESTLPIDCWQLATHGPRIMQLVRFWMVLLAQIRLALALWASPICWVLRTT